MLLFFTFFTIKSHTAVCSSPSAILTLFLPLALEIILAVSLFFGFFRLDLMGLLMLAENRFYDITNYDVRSRNRESLEF